MEMIDATKTQFPLGHFVQLNPYLIAATGDQTQGSSTL